MQVKYDKFWMSAMWGRIGAAIVLVIGTVLQNAGVDVTQDQMDDAHNLIGMLIDNVHIVIAAAMVIVSKLRERRKLDASQSGRIELRLLAVVLAVCIAVATFAGCAPNQSATAQIMRQTNDPGTIAFATFVDAQDAYIAAQELYLPYQAAVQAEDLALDRLIIGYFTRAEELLGRWELYGTLPQADKESLRDYIRRITIEAAKAAEGKR